MAASMRRFYGRSVYASFSNYFGLLKRQSHVFNILNGCKGGRSDVNTNYLLNGIHTSPVDRSLMEFFDDENNWGESLVKVGRSWRLEELRIKSNEDLHKLWYVLLKEKNMLLTMEHVYKEECETFPNPERIDKVKESMSNLETIVKERNKAYHELEIGNYSEVPKLDRSTPFRHLFWRQKKEYAIPKHENIEWQKNEVKFTGAEAEDFVKLMSRKIHNRNRHMINMQTSRVVELMKMFPNVDEEAIKAQYPDVDLVKIKRRLELLYREK